MFSTSEKYVLMPSKTIIIVFSTWLNRLPKIFSDTEHSFPPRPIASTPYGHESYSANIFRRLCRKIVSIFWHTPHKFQNRQKLRRFGGGKFKSTYSVSWKRLDFCTCSAKSRLVCNISIFLFCCTLGLYFWLLLAKQKCFFHGNVVYRSDFTSNTRLKIRFINVIKWVMKNFW